MPRPLHACLLLATGCSHPSVMIGPPPDDSEAPAPDSEAPDDDDTGGAEHIPTSVLRPLFDPPPGGFSVHVEVTVTSSTGEGLVRACVTTPTEPCEPAPVTGPLSLTSSSIVIAEVNTDGAASGPEAASYVRLSDDIAAFSSNLPVLVFWTDGAAPSSTTPVALGLDLFEPGEGRTHLTDPATDSGRARLKTRGRSTAGVPKHSFDLELWQADSEADRPLELLGMPEDGDWILQAPYSFDDALIRNALGFALSNRIGRYAPRTRFAEVFVAEHGAALATSHFQGLYVVTEEIERGADRIDVTPIGPGDVAEPEVTGGYVFKRDRLGDGEVGMDVGLAGGAFSFLDPMVWVDPAEDEVVPAQAAYLSGLVDEFAWAIVQPDFTNPTTGRHYGEIIDVDSWIDHHILNVFIKNPDAFRLSGYMSKDREGPIVAGPLWDLDRTAGGNDTRCTDPTWWDAWNVTSDTTPYFTWAWYGALFEDPAFRERYWARWREVLASELAIEVVLAEIDALAEPLPEAAARNSEAWYTPEFGGQIDALREWFTARHAWITACLEQGGDPRECQGG
ncbi:MAG: CotH kinase family protein [Pseudomonadota bacterium]